MTARRFSATVPAEVDWAISFLHYADRIDVAVVGMVEHRLIEHGGRPDGIIQVRFPDGCSYTIIRNSPEHDVRERTE